MKAIWYESTGPARQVLEFGEVETPRPGPGEVRVRVAASGLNPSDTKRRSGWLGTAMRHRLIIPHSDGAGTVDAVGEGVDPGRIGERVWVWNAQGGERPFGTAAEYVTVPADRAVGLPNGVSFAVGAGLGVPGCTAHYAVYGDGPVAGKRILVQGGAGAVGHLAVQLAVLGGAEVIATVSDEKKAEVARGGGARHVINYRREDVVARVRDFAAGEGVDRTGAPLKRLHCPRPRQSTTSTPDPAILPALSAIRASLASSSPNRVTWGRIGISAASSRSSRPSARVLASTL